jgi:transcriptional regulator with XRE-family HTH domain
MGCDVTQGGGNRAGAQIRARRQARGLGQGALARQVGISPSYLNLIEHDRRRIGGKLLVALAAALDADPADLTPGGETPRGGAPSACSGRCRRRGRGSGA